DHALAVEARKKLSQEEIDEALLKVNPNLGLAQTALNAIILKDYHGPLLHMAKEIIDLGLGVYNYGSQVKAAFGPKWLSGLNSD
ncbi:MAG: hypothetical protein LBT38_02735, partial [Deltaproteobacteria bacterium]|nr:hypothetical protein [Deltaproteobacteria bacterium]